MASKIYTANELREKAKVMLGGLCNGVITMPSQASSRDVAAMLRQAADTEEELAKLKARLEAVVNEIDNKICHPSESNCKKCGDYRGNCQCGSLSNNGMMKLLKFAKGE